MASEIERYPVFLKGEFSESLSRWLWLIKWFLLIPHFVVLIFLWIAFVIAWVIALFAILFTRRYPRSLFDYNVGVLRWTWRVGFYSYMALGTDKYPPFSLEPGGYPADLEITYPEKDLSRGLVLIKWWLLAIPHYIVISFFQGGGGPHQGGLIILLVLFAGIALLFTGKYPKDVFHVVMGMNRWCLRVCAYAALMTDRYPPFRFE